MDMGWKELYHMRLSDIAIPILPETLKEMIQMDNDKYDIVGLGERVRPGKEKLHTWTISSYFPSEGEISPKEYKEKIEKIVLRDYSKNVDSIKPVRFAVARELENGTIIFSINADVLIESIEWEDRKGEPGDLYYTIKLIEYKPFDQKKV